MFRRGFRRFGTVVTKAIQSRLGRWAHKTTGQWFKAAALCKQPVADSYITDIFATAQGSFSIGAGSKTSGFAFSLNYPVFPFNQVGALGVGLPNPIIANNTNDPAGLKNLLFNSGTATGLWLNGITLATAVELTVQPQNIGDNVKVVMVPVANSTANYGNPENAGAGPNSVERTFTSVYPSKMYRSWSPAAIAGIPDRLWESQMGTYNFTFASAPVPQQFVQVWYRTMNNVDLVSILPVMIRVRYTVRFFNRADAALLDT